MNKIKSDSGFMGPTHATSAIAFYLLLFLFAKPFLYNLGLSDNITGIIGSLVIVTGAALFPDLDNTRSTAMSVLGPIGKLLSEFMRAISVGVYHLTKTKYDKPEADPHRGFWHTIIAGILLGLLVYLSLIFNNIFTVYIAAFWVFICCQLAMSALFNSFVKRNKTNIIGQLGLTLIGLGVTFVVITLSNNNFNWIAPSFALGYIFHIIGDTMTVSGTPLLWPIKRKGKRWYTYRIMKLKAGGEIEKKIILPVFTIISVICIVLILTNGLL